MRSRDAATHTGSVRLSVRRIPTKGVRVEDGVVEHPGLGVRAPVRSVAALEAGLMSERLSLNVGGRRIDLPPWVSSDARSLPPGAVPAALGAVRHFASGSAPLLVVGAATLVIGAATGSPGLLGLATLALVLLAALLLHEVGHVVAYRVLFGATAPAVTVVRGVSCRLVRLADDSRADVAVVAAGAAGPAICVVAALPLVAVAPYPVVLGGVVALGHLAALALPVGDGAALREIAARRRRT